MAGSQDVINQNLALRNALLATSPRMSKKIGTITETSSIPGKTSRIKLFNVGVITKIRLVVTINVTIGTATATLSPKAPYNAIANIKLTDFEGTDRVNLSGYQLWVLQSIRERTPAYFNNEGTSKNNTMPVAPTAVGTADLKFYVEVPLAYDAERDLRGAVLAQTGLGDMFLQVTYNSSFYANGSDDSVYNGAATSTVAVNSVSIDVYQDFLQPQSIGGQIPLPMQDLMTVYELLGNYRITDNMSNGQERLFNYPNARTVIGFYLNWLNNSLMSDAISNFRVIANGNNVLMEHSLDSQQMTQRMHVNSDLPKGTFFQLHRSRPIETVIYGNVQWGATFSAAPTGTFYMEQLIESFYTKGATLPGLSNQ